MARFKYAGIWTDQKSKPVASGTITIYEAGTTTLATAYDAETGSALTGSQTTTDSTGVFHFWVDESDWSVPSTQRFRVIGTKTGFSNLDDEQTDDIIVFTSTPSATETLTNKTISTDDNTITINEADIQNLGTAIALVADKLDVFAATTSAELAGVLSDETGSGGGFVRATSPTLGTPVLTTPTATNAVLNTAVSGTAVLDEDNMSSDSATKIATQQSIKKYVDDNTITPGTESTATGGTAINFTSIPSGVKRIVISIVGLSLSGTDEPIIRIGTSGTAETSGYLSATGNSGSSAGATSGFLLVHTSADAAIYHGTIILSLEDSTGFTWTSISAINRSDSVDAYSGSGSKSLAAELDMISVTQTGSDTIDANGGINIQFQQ